MKIRITKQLQVEKSIRPEVGSVHEVVYHQQEGMYNGRIRQEMFFINVGLAQVGVRNDECRIVEAHDD